MKTIFHHLEKSLTQLCLHQHMARYGNFFKYLLNGFHETIVSPPSPPPTSKKIEKERERERNTFVANVIKVNKDIFIAFLKIFFIKKRAFLVVFQTVVDHLDHIRNLYLWI